MTMHVRLNKFITFVVLERLGWIRKKMMITPPDTSQLSGFFGVAVDIVVLVNMAAMLLKISKIVSRCGIKI